MKNFSHLLIKEIKELLNKQLIISLVFILVIFYFIGNVTRGEMKRAMAKQKVAVLGPRPVRNFPEHHRCPEHGPVHHRRKIG